MLTPSLPSPDERGKHWLQTQVQQLLAASAVALATPRSADDAACYWGTSLETGTTLYVRLAGDPEPKALRFNRALLYDWVVSLNARDEVLSAAYHTTRASQGTKVS
jgi:hypothetical protein